MSDYIPLFSWINTFSDLGNKAPLTWEWGHWVKSKYTVRYIELFIFRLVHSVKIMESHAVQDAMIAWLVHWNAIEASALIQKSLNQRAKMLAISSIYFPKIKPD